MEFNSLRGVQMSEKRVIFEWVAQEEWGPQRQRFVQEGDNVLLLMCRNGDDSGWYQLHRFVSKGMVNAINCIVDYACR